MSNDATKQKSSSNKKLLGIMQFIMPLLLIALGILLIRRRDALNNVFMAIGIFIALIGLIYTVIYLATKQYEKNRLISLLESECCSLVESSLSFHFWLIPLFRSALVCLFWSVASAD